MKILRKIRTLSRVLRKLGIWAVLRLIFQKVSGVAHVNSNVAFDPAGLNLSTSPKHAIFSFCQIDPALLDSYDAEFEEYMRDFELRLKKPRSTFFEEIFDLGPNMGQFLYLWIRFFKPKLVIETGVAAGASTNTILSALDKNGYGRLESIDITSRVGELIESRLKVNWDLHVINPKVGSSAIGSILKGKQEASLFLHDSDHSDEWQITEFEAATTYLPKGSLIAFDDVTNALINYVETRYPEVKTLVFDENRKYSALFLADTSLKES